jgi:hypothetical protein
VAEVDETYRSLTNDSGEPLDVRGEPAVGESYRSLDFVFERGVLSLACDDDTDEILVTAEHAPSTSTDVSGPPLNAPLGKVIEYAWVMTNHRGYRDAFQVRFVDLDTKATDTRQFEVAASTIVISSVSPW